MEDISTPVMVFCVAIGVLAFLKALSVALSVWQRWQRMRIQSYALENLVRLTELVFDDDWEFTSDSIESRQYIKPGCTFLRPDDKSGDWMNREVFLAAIADAHTALESKDGRGDE